LSSPLDLDAGMQNQVDASFTKQPHRTHSKGSGQESPNCNLPLRVGANLAFVTIRLSTFEWYKSPVEGLEFNYFQRVFRLASFATFRSSKLEYKTLKGKYGRKNAH